MRSRSADHQTVWARGPYIRSLRWSVLVIWVVSALAHGAISSYFWTSLAVALALEAVLLRPRVISSETDVVLVGIVGRVRFARNDIAAFRLVPSGLLWFNTTVLCVAAASDVVTYRWVAWSDWRQYGSPLESPTPRQQRVLDVICSGGAPPAGLRWF